MDERHRGYGLVVIVVLRLGELTRRAGDQIHCKGCGRDTGAHWPETPVPDRCDHCPPQQCHDCGQLDSATEHCPCWKSLEGMTLADIKAVFAASDLSIDPKR